MHGMIVGIGWADIVLRLALTIFAGGLIGFDRDERGKSAGLRTTLLVCLAASVAMIQTNLLLPVAGKEPGSFVTMDLMRLPLGILSGVGFLGAGAIIRRSDRVRGVTTAATLWIVTVIGLCFGGGQLGLGMVATGLGVGVLWGIKRIEDRLHQQHRGTLTIASERSAADLHVPALLRRSGFVIAAQAVEFILLPPRHETRFDLHWRCRADQNDPPALLTELAAKPGILSYEWAPGGTPGI